MTENEVEKRRDRQYIRSYTRDWLMNGITAYLTEAEQAVWHKLNHLAGAGVPPGTIQLYPDQLDPYAEIASSIHSKPSRIKTTLDKLQRRGKVSMQDNIITITNWDTEQPQIQTRFPGKEWEGTQSKTPRTKKARLEQQAERKRLRLCELCGEEGHTKFDCPHSKLQGLVQR